MGELAFVPLDGDAAAAFIEDSRIGFIDGQVALGEDRAAVEARTQAIHARIFPGGRLHPDHRVIRIVDGEAVVGHLWIAREDGSPDHYVWDIVIDASHRGRGLGRAAMEHAHAIARAQGAPAIGLSVVASNDVAIGLYRSLGYEQTGAAMGPLVQMRKVL